MELMASTARNIEPIVGCSGFMTLQTHMLADEHRFPDSGGALSWIISALAISTKTISARLKRARLEDVLGEVGHDNIHGEHQQKLDVIAKDVSIQVLRGRDGVAVLGSEEADDLLFVNTRTSDGSRYAVLFGPMDGSSNLDVAGAVGTIFSIFKIEPESSERLYPGRRQVSAGYVLYGSSTIFVLTTGAGVHMFVLDSSIGAYIRVAESIRLPEFGATYSINEANAAGFPRGYRRYLQQCRDENFSSRYVGAMVADVHRVLLNGGIFMYPPTQKSPGGKLRLMYEANPMAMIFEQAGGVATTGDQQTLDIPPSGLHQRVPVVLGSPDNVADLQECLNE